MSHAANGFNLFNPFNPAPQPPSQIRWWPTIPFHNMLFLGALAPTQVTQPAPPGASLAPPPPRPPKQPLQKTLPDAMPAARHTLTSQPPPTPSSLDVLCPPVWSRCDPTTGVTHNIYRGYAPSHMLCTNKYSSGCLVRGVVFSPLARPGFVPALVYAAKVREYKDCIAGNMPGKRTKKLDDVYHIVFSEGSGEYLVLHPENIYLLDNVALPKTVKAKDPTPQAHNKNRRVTPIRSDGGKLTYAMFVRKNNGDKYGVHTYLWRGSVRDAYVRGVVKGPGPAVFVWEDDLPGLIPVLVDAGEVLLDSKGNQQFKKKGEKMSKLFKPAKVNGRDVFMITYLRDGHPVIEETPKDPEPPAFDQQTKVLNKMITELGIKNLTMRPKLHGIISLIPELDQNGLTQVHGTRRGHEAFFFRPANGPRLCGYIMFHGTVPENVAGIVRHGFRLSEPHRNMLGAGVYVSRNPDKTDFYGCVTLKLIVYAGHSHIIDRQNHPYQKVWQTPDCDSAWVPPHCGMVKSGREETCVKESWQVGILGVCRGYERLSDTAKVRISSVSETRMSPAEYDIVQQMFEEVRCRLTRKAKG